VRTHGEIDSGSGLGHDGHACWGFDDPQEFVDAALEFLADGLRLGQRLAYVDSEPVAEQRERLEPLGDVDAMVEAGMLVLFELKDLYRVGEPVDVETQVAIYSAAADAALADGYTGLRVAAQVTEPETWDAHLRWESAADRVLSAKSLSALCGYRRDALPPQLLRDLAAIHPAANAAAGPAPFHLFGERGGLVLSGEVDCFSVASFERALGFASGEEEAISLDLAALEFIDHRGFEVLAARTRRDGSGAVVENKPPVVERLCELLDVDLG
jgi:anti-anti-sigma regulatory factor